MSGDMQTEMLEELKKIRELLEPKPAPPAAQPKGIVNEFKVFLSTYKVMGMAVAFIMGMYVGGLVSALVSDLIMPIITIVIPGVEWELLTVGSFRVGHFVGTFITFIMVLS